MTQEKGMIYIARGVLALSAMTLLSTGQLVLNFRSGSVPEERTQQTLAEVYVSRAERQREELARLCELAHDESVPEDIRLLAGEREMQLRAQISQEAAIEAVLAARGYAAVLVTVQPLSVNVIIEGGALSEQEAAVILELVMRECGVTGESIKIIRIN